MYLTPLFVVISVCLSSAQGRFNNGNILMNPIKSRGFLEVFMKNVAESGSFPIQQADINGIIQSLVTAISEAQAKAASSAFASMMADLIAIGDDKSLINGRKNAIQRALQKTYTQLGEQIDKELLQDIRNQINDGINVYKGLGIGFGFQDKKNVGLGLGVEDKKNIELGLGVEDKKNIGLGLGVEDKKNIGLGIEDTKNIGLGIEDKKNIGLGIGVEDKKSIALDFGTNVGFGIGVDAGVDVAAYFKLRLLTGLNSAGIFDGYNGAVSKNQLNLVSRILVELLSKRFNLQLGNSYITNCYQALSVLEISFGFDAYLAVLVDFTSQLLLQKGLLTDVDSALRNSCEAIILACSKAFNLKIDIDVALDIALSTDVGEGVDAVVGFGHGEEVTAGVDYGVLVQIAKKFESLLKSSEKLNIAALSGNSKSVFFTTVPAVRDTLGSEAGNALAHCFSSGFAVGNGLGVDVGVGKR